MKNTRNFPQIITLSSATDPSWRSQTGPPTTFRQGTLWAVMPLALQVDNTG